MNVPLKTARFTCDQSPVTNYFATGWTDPQVSIQPGDCPSPDPDPSLSPSPATVPTSSPSLPPSPSRSPSPSLLPSPSPSPSSYCLKYTGCDFNVVYLLQQCNSPLVSITEDWQTPNWPGCTPQSLACNGVTLSLWWNPGGGWPKSTEVVDLSFCRASPSPSLSPSPSPSVSVSPSADPSPSPSPSVSPSPSLSPSPSPTIIIFPSPSPSPSPSRSPRFDRLVIFRGNQNSQLNETLDSSSESANINENLSEAVSLQLGDPIYVKTDYIAIKFYDSGQFRRDGDIISATINGQPSELDVLGTNSSAIELSNTDRVYTFRLKEDSNTLRIGLLSEGSVRPSTVGFTIKPLFVQPNEEKKAILGPRDQSFYLTFGLGNPPLPPVLWREFEIIVRYPEITIDGSRYPESAKHIQDAQPRFNSSDLLTLDRSGKNSRYQLSVQAFPVDWRYYLVPRPPRNSYCERDEWPPSTFLENNGNADVKYVTGSDNAGAGSQIGRVSGIFEDGAKFRMKATNVNPSTKYCVVPPQPTPAN